MFEEPKDTEHRHFPRVSFREAVQFSIQDPSMFTGSLSADLSEGGLRLRVNEFIAPGTFLRIQMKLPQHEIVECPAKVVWTEKERYSDRYQVGLEFNEVDLPLHQKNRIHQVIQSV